VFSESASEVSSFDGSNASDDEGSDFDEEDSEGQYQFKHLRHRSLPDAGEDWDELERKAAKSDKKKVDNGKADASSSEDERPKKKSVAVSKANGKSKR
jgi:hypothetical protein